MTKPPRDDDGRMRELCVKQGYVPEKCEMDGFMIMAFMNDGRDPCLGCTTTRSVCGGRHKSPTDYEVPARERPPRRQTVFGGTAPKPWTDEKMRAVRNAGKMDKGW